MEAAHNGVVAHAGLNDGRHTTGERPPASTFRGLIHRDKQLGGVRKCIRTGRNPAVSCTLRSTPLQPPFLLAMLLNGVFGHLKLVLLLVAHIGIAGAANVLAQTQSVSTASSSSSSFGATSTGTHGSNSSSHKKKKLGKGAIGGIGKLSHSLTNLRAAPTNANMTAVAVLVLVVLVALAIYFIYKRICGKRREVSSSAVSLPFHFEDYPLTPSI